MVFITLSLTLLSSDSGKLVGPSHPPRASLYRALVSRLREQQEDLGVRPGEGDVSWHFSMARLQQNRAKELVYVTFLGQEAPGYAYTLLNTLSACPFLEEGPQAYEVLSMDLAHPQGPPVATWEDMLTPIRGRHLCLRFLSPLTLRGPARNVESGVYFPDPFPLFSCLQRRWQQLSGPPLADDLQAFLREGGCVVADCRLSMSNMTLENGDHVGVIGWIRYACRERAYTDTLYALARLACYTGTGYYTEQGMGVTRLVSEP